MDGIEVVDMSSCMNFPEGATRQFKIDACDPEVYRYRWPTVDFAQLEHVPRDRAPATSSRSIPTTGSPAPPSTPRCCSTSRTRSTTTARPTDYSDDKPRGTPLPCARRESSTAADPLATSAFVEDCVIGEGGQSLRVPGVAAR